MSVPQTHGAYFATREQAEACAAALGDEYLSAVEPVERPWVLRAARPVAAGLEGERELEVMGVVERCDGDYFDCGSPLTDEHDEPFRWPDED